MKTKLKDMIAKALRGETLNALERAELENFDPDALNRKLEELERAQLTCEEALRHDLDDAVRERDEIRAERDELRRKNRIGAIARDSGCDNAEFLDFLAGKAQIDLDDDQAVARFVANAEHDHPALFRSRLQPGTGGAPVPAPAASGAAEVPDRIGAIVAALGGAPEAE